MRKLFKDVDVNLFEGFPMNIEEKVFGFLALFSVILVVGVVLALTAPAPEPEEDVFVDNYTSDEPVCSPETPEECDVSCNSDEECWSSCGCGCINEDEDCFNEGKICAAVPPCSCDEGECTQAIPPEKNEPSRPSTLYAVYEQDVTAHAGQEIVFPDCAFEITDLGEEASFIFSYGDASQEYALSEGSFYMGYLLMEIKSVSDGELVFELTDPSRKVGTGNVNIGLQDPVIIEDSDVRLMVAGSTASSYLYLFENEKMYSFSGNEFIEGTNFTAGDYTFTFVVKIFEDTDRNEMKYMFQIYEEESA